VVDTSKKQKIIIVGGPPASGKTSVVCELIKILKYEKNIVGVCKIDCLKSLDCETYKKMGVYSVLGLSKDTCPDHFLAVNLEEITLWGEKRGLDTLFIETAGLCHRCAPATKNTIAICVLDCTQGIGVPEKIGPVLTSADIVIITKTDLVSQAEAEVFYQSIKNLNEDADIIEVNGTTGTGANYLKITLDKKKSSSTVVGDTLRHEMPSAICSYCVGERRIGNIFQQGIVSKMEFEE
jgi:Ni2+-binding GTPase involved in maturation of urease and hydrogenase